MSESPALDPSLVEPRAVEYASAGSVALEGEAEPVYGGLRLSSWMKIVAVAVLMALLFRFNLRRLWLKTNPFTGEANWGHAICVPFIGLYYLYVNREELLKAPVKASWTGLGILVLGLAIFQYGIWPGRNDWTSDFGMVIALMGVALLLAGWQVMRIAWFPIAFLVCALPWPGLVYSWVAMPLQRLAANVAVIVLQMTGVTASSGGTKIFIGGTGQELRTLNVAEACAGLRSLMTFISVGAAVAFLSPRSLWQKIIITMSAVPIAIFCNVMRVAGQGLLDHYVSRELSESFAHQFVGLIMLIPAFFLILGVGWVLDRIFLEEADDKEQLGPVTSAMQALPTVTATRITPAAPAEAAGQAYQQWVLPQSKRNAAAPPRRTTAPAAPAAPRAAAVRKNTGTSRPRSEKK